MFNNETVRNAIDHHIKNNPHILTDFTYDGMVGFEAFNVYVFLNEEFELEITTTYLDHKHGLTSQLVCPI